MPKFDINTSFYHNGYWFDEEGNRITDSEYAKLLSASTWNDLDPNDLIVDDEELRADRDFREYIMGINL